MIRLYTKSKEWLIGDYVSNRSHIHDKARAELLFNASFLVFSIGLPLCVYMLLAGIYGKVLPTALGLVFIVGQILIFRKFQNIFASAFFLCLLTTAIVAVNINFNRETIHLVEPFWMIVIVVFATFMLGVRWGILFFLLLMSAFVVYVTLFLERDLAILLASPQNVKHFMAVEIAAALFILIYILSMFVVTTRKSERALRNVNIDLEQQNRLVQHQNAEITILLKEIHHRVKNNLQVINSLLRLQSEQISDETALGVFEDVQNRIKAIALIHERMYKAVELSDIDSNDYFMGLSHDLLRQSLTNHQIALHVDVELPNWNQDIVVPLGLLINELIANSVEHGKMVTDGKIYLGMFEENGKLRLTYRDNGIGFEITNGNGFGLELIETLTAQLNGEMQLKTSINNGVHYEFQFQL